MKKLSIYVLIVIMCINTSFAQDADFHPAQTEAEKALKESLSNINYKNSVTQNFLSSLNNRNMSFQLFTCSQQNKIEHPKFRTLYQDDNKAVITYEYTTKLTDYPLYKLINTNNEWKIDGMYCLEKVDNAIQGEFEVNIYDEILEYCNNIAMTQWAMTFCADRHAKDIRKEMNEVLSQIRERNKDNPEKLKKLEKAQASWKQSMKDDLDLLYCDHTGSARPMCVNYDASAYINKRTEYLKSIIKESDSGHNMCGSL